MGSVLMGREIKRVPLDFDWPWEESRKPWQGYLMPESLSFPECEIGHDAIDHWNFDKKIIAAAGLPDTWGQCPTCSGRGHLATPEQEAAQEAWERTEPPEGEGYQLWETVSEGSPITPVFATPEELAQWMTEHSWGSQKDRMASSFDVAMRFIEAGWAPSGMASPEHGVETGVEAVGRS